MSMEKTCEGTTDCTAERSKGRRNSHSRGFKFLHFFEVLQALRVLHPSVCVQETPVQGVAFLSLRKSAREHFFKDWCDLCRPTTCRWVSSVIKLIKSG